MMIEKHSFVLHHRSLSNSIIRTHNLTDPHLLFQTLALQYSEFALAEKVSEGR